jgi:hypothetical protein
MPLSKASSFSIKISTLLHGERRRGLSRFYCGFVDFFLNFFGYVDEVHFSSGGEFVGCVMNFKV